VLLVVWHELTERRTREAELRRRLEQLDLQRQVIRRLSTPIIAVAPGVLLVPVVGALDRERAVAMTAAVLAAIAERRARTVIVDLTGADDLVAETIVELVRIATASALLGAEVVHAGISPSLARTLVELGTALPNFRTTRTAEQAIAEALHLPSI
jgi:rsbT co-antagonist protein RsbR